MDIDKTPDKGLGYSNYLIKRTKVKRKVFRCFLGQVHLKLAVPS